MSKPAQKKKRERKPQGGVIGIDEVGRGPLAGPVTVCAFYIADEITKKWLKKVLFGERIKDSKKLKKELRINIFRIIRKNGKLKNSVKYSISSRSAMYIDRHGISKAIQACTLSCIGSLSKQGLDIHTMKINLDAGLSIPMDSLKQESFVKGDEKYLEIALASILAKVTRDTHMERLARVHTEYGWESNVGYGTLAHGVAIRKYGITKHHRTSYLKGFKLLD